MHLKAFWKMKLIQRIKEYHLKGGSIFRFGYLHSGTKIGHIKFLFIFLFVYTINYLKKAVVLIRHCWLNINRAVTRQRPDSLIVTLTVESMIAAAGHSGVYFPWLQWGFQALSDFFSSEDICHYLKKKKKRKYICSNLELSGTNYLF